MGKIFFPYAFYKSEKTGMKIVDREIGLANEYMSSPYVELYCYNKSRRSVE